MKTVGVIFAPGFEEIEAITIVDVLRRAGLTVLTIGLDAEMVKGAHDIEVKMDKTIAQLSAAELDAVVLPGGMPGATNLAKHERVLKLVKRLHDQGNYVGAICAAPIALQAAGLLAARNVTCYPGFESQLAGSTCTGSRVSVDGTIVTGIGPGAAIEFSLRLVELLIDSKKAAQLRQQMIV